MAANSTVVSRAVRASKPPQPILAIVRGLHEEVVQQLDLARRIAHPGESGRAREEIMRRFLRRFVPAGLGIDTGFVIDVHGGISRQIDIVIYRDSYHPILEIGGIKHFFAESVIAVIENKAVIGSREVLRGALNNVRSAKVLDRSGGGANHIVMDFHGGGPLVNNSNPHDRIWTAIVTGETVAAEILVDGLVADMHEHRRAVWLDTYVAVRQFATRYLDDESAPVWYADTARSLVLTNPDAPDGEPPLVDFALLLANRLRHAAIVDYAPQHYFPSSASQQNTVDLADL